MSSSRESVERLGSIEADGEYVDESIEIQWQIDAPRGAPANVEIVAWARAALAENSLENTGVTIRIVDAMEIKSSNKQWRNIDKATNVLSFAADFPAEAGIPYLGDILICAEVLQRESQEQGKKLADHWAHIVVHGLLHLQGYDHENDQDADAMEQREREILATLRVADPYRDEIDQANT